MCITDIRQKDRIKKLGFLLTCSMTSKARRGEEKDLEIKSESRLVRLPRSLHGELGHSGLLTSADLLSLVSVLRRVKTKGGTEQKELVGGLLARVEAIEW